MAYYSIFPEKDSTIYSHPNRTGLNTGRDEVLELLEEKSSTAELYYPSRFLIKFKNTEIKDIIENKLNGNDFNTHLEVFSTAHKSLHANHIVQVYAVSQSWDEGTGRFKNNPSSSNGLGDICRVGGVVGAFFITVICASLTHIGCVIDALVAHSMPTAVSYSA